MHGSSFDYIYDVPVEKISLNFNKPYMFIIRDKKTGEVWFAGTVYNPLSLKDEPEAENQNKEPEAMIRSYSEFEKSFNNNYESGDVTCDGQVNDWDGIYLERYLAGKSGYTLTEQEKKRADVNQDGKVDKTDLDIIKKYIDGGYDTLPVGNTTNSNNNSETTTNTATQNEKILLGNKYKNNMGISFDYPSDWKLLDNGSGSVSVGLSNPKTSENDKYDEVLFTIQWLSNDVNTTPKQYIEEAERARGSYDEKGNIRFGDYQGYYCVGDFYQRKDFNYKTIYITVNSSMYEIRFGGNITLYNKYYTTFEKMLETVKFTTPTNTNSID